MPSTKSIIQVGLQLLKDGRLEANELDSYREAFSILKIDVSNSLKLGALKSVFSAPDDKTDNYFQPVALHPEHINYPCNSAPPGDVQGFGEAEMAGSNELTLLEKYGTFVSVITTTDAVDSAVHSQTPVYDLFKTASAIDDCLKKGRATKNSCWLDVIFPVFRTQCTLFPQKEHSRHFVPAHSCWNCSPSILFMKSSQP